MDALERLVLHALADGNPKTAPQIRKFFEVAYNKVMSERKGRTIALQDQNIYYTTNKMSDYELKKCPFCNKKLSRGDIDSAINNLKRVGFVDLKVVEGKKMFYLREGCIDGVLVFRSSGNKAKIWECPDVFSCTCLADENGFRKVDKSCVQYEDYDRVRVPFRLLF